MAKWICLTTDDGEMHSAYVEGHVRPVPVSPADFLQIETAFKGLVADEELQRLRTEPLPVRQHWMRPQPPLAKDPREQLFEFCDSGDEPGAFPVTGVRFDR
ncbi:hypothetical protein [Aureimonas sp. AU12]|uniref:hypothetical protein n=1 Tax=Aureimonas sp. AU12 TaxID=1638161 RepID=UPI000784D1E0|nr:hypothetical protein [Aureimonas sp. AU12]